MDNQECAECKCSTCIHQMDELFETTNKTDCTMCSWCKGELQKKECTEYDSGLTAESFLNQIIFFDPNDLGRIVRNAWIEWAKEQPNPKPSWLVPYDELNQADKDADIRIGQAVVNVCNKGFKVMYK